MGCFTLLSCVRVKEGMEIVKESPEGSWGFYGDEERGKEYFQDCLDEARSSAGYILSERTKKHCQRLKAQIRAHVPIEKRMALAI